MSSITNDKTMRIAADATLPPPDFPEADENAGWINIRLAKNGTPARLSWTGISINDTVNLSWYVYTQFGELVFSDTTLTGTVTEGDVAAGYLDVLIPPEDIPDNLQSGRALSWYLMTPASGGAQQKSRTSEVGVDTQA